MKYIVYPISLIIILLTSCNSTNLVTIDIRRPATITFPPEIVNIVVVDNTTKEDEEKESKEDEKGLLSIDSTKTIFLKSLRQYMSEENYFNKVEIYPYQTNHNQDKRVIALSDRKVEAICIEKDADALISLDMFTISAQLETENTAYFSNYTILGAKLGTLVRVFSKDGTEYREPIVQLDSLYREESSDWTKVRKNIPEINNLLAEISTVGADRLTGKFIPSWSTQDRWYYSNSSSRMKEAANFLKKSQWKEASTIWKTLFDKENNSQQKIRLASNIALAQEYMDNIDAALEWINKAYELLPQKSKNSDLALQVVAYRKVIEKRHATMPTLYKQLGISEEK
ncbi:MAG: DUF6340 family protein [Prevotella sp.]|jgi:tetratricopeptide (TPR) repeat protein|nr:DUF6340 family protein [Prevotella sp.]